MKGLPVAFGRAHPYLRQKSHPVEPGPKDEASLASWRALTPERQLFVNSRDSTWFFRIYTYDASPVILNRYQAKESERAPISMDCPLLICSLKKPRIYWYQTDLEVVMRIMLHDVEDYFLRVKIDEFEFSTNHEGVDYYLNLHLFGAVIADKTSHKTTGREITVRLPKVHKWADWPRLIYSSAKSTQIFVDVERLGANKPKKQLVPTWNEKKFSAYKLRNRITQIMPDVPSSNEEDSADEGYNLIFE